MPAAVDPGAGFPTTPVNYGPTAYAGAFAGYQQLQGLSGQLMGMPGTWAAAGSGYGASPWSQGSGFGSYNSAGSMSGYYLGGSQSHCQVPIYQDRVYRDAYQCVVHDKQVVECNTPGKMWDVWFDHVDGQKTTRRSPIVLDLNSNGKPDITGQNILGDGKVTGEPVMFDIDPSKNSYQYQSVQRRPGSGAPAIKGGKVVYADGTTEQLGKKGKVSKKNEKKHGNEAKYYDANGNLVGETKKDEKTGKVMYHWGNVKAEEKTEWLAKGGGDGMLVWDVDNDGKITSSKELFGEFDVDGKKKFTDGYQKLAHHFDKNKDGKVEGAELQGLKVWKDANGDGKTDAGELQELGQHNINSLDVANINRSDMSSTFNKQTTSVVDNTRVVNGYHERIQREQVGWAGQSQYSGYAGGFDSAWGQQNNNHYTQTWNQTGGGYGGTYGGYYNNQYQANAYAGVPGAWAGAGATGIGSYAVAGAATGLGYSSANAYAYQGYQGYQQPGGGGGYWAE